MAVGVAIAAAVIAAVGTGYAIESGESQKRKQKHAKEENEELIKKNQAAADAEAARREEELKLQKERMATEAADRQKQLDAYKSSLQTSQSTNLRTARRSLLATEGSVWESRAATKQRTLLGNSPVQGKTLLGQ